MMNNKLLVICGPTATGKTGLALALAKKFNGEIISADSRQVYRGMDIGTGKDIPVNAKWQMLNDKYGCYEIDGVRVWGYDLADPKEEFSVSHYVRIAKKIISDIQKRGKLPILVGGTGFYIKAVVDGIPTVDVPQNNDLRDQLSGKSPEELFEHLSQTDPIKAGSMNFSDKKNPRRLIRAIEVAQYLIDHRLPANKTLGGSILFIGLDSSKDELDRKIHKRVEERLKAGIKKEIKKLIAGGVSWDGQAMMSLGYRQWRDYFEGGVPQENVVDEWVREEKKYARRQATWFKKDRRIVWFDISSSLYTQNVENLVKKWDNGQYNA